MGTRETYQTTLVRACLIVGDEQALAERLGVPVRTLTDWLFGDTVVPTDVFLTCVDILIASNKDQISDNRAFLEQIKKSYGR